MSTIPQGRLAVQSTCHICRLRIAVAGIAALGIALLLAASGVWAQPGLDDRQLVQAVDAAVRDQSNRGAFRKVLQNYDRYRQLVAEGRIPAANVEVVDNQVWDLSLRVWDKVKAADPEGVERVDLVGSGGRRLEPGSSYKVGKSDLDFIPRGPRAEEAAAEYMKRLAAEMGADPHKIGINALSPVQAERTTLIEAANHPEKYCTPERLKALDYQQYSTGLTVVWDDGRPQRVSVRDLYARNGWPPPPEPTALDAFGSAAAEQKFLNESVRKGLSGAEKAVYEAKYHARTLDSAVKLGGVELPLGGEAVERELRAIAESKSVRTALADRIARHGGNVEAAVAEYLQDATDLNKRVTADLLRKHIQLLHGKAAAGGEALAEAQQSVRQLQHSLAIYSDAQTRELLKNAGLKPANIETVAEKVSKFRIEVAVEGERAAIEAQRVARAIAAHLPPAERAAFEAQIAALSKTAGGRSLIQHVAETMRARPVSSALIALAAASEIRHVASVAGEKGWAAGSLAAGNAAGDWYLMSVSPHYAVARLAIDLGKLGVELTITGPIKESTARVAYEGDAGFLGHIGLSRGELTRRFATEAEALDEARQWYQKWMVTHGEYLGKTEVEEAFYRQVRADYETSRWLQMARDYSFDPQTGQYGERGFFRRVGNGQITFENFARRFPNEEAVQRVIDYYFDYTWYYDWEEYGGKPADRDAREQLLRKYLLELWKASAKFNAELDKARQDAAQEAGPGRRRSPGSVELTADDLLKPPSGGDNTAAIDAIRAAPTVPEAVRRTWTLLRKLQQMAEAIREEVAGLNRLADAVSAHERMVSLYQRAVEADQEFLAQTDRQLAALRTAIVGGALGSAAVERLRAEFQAVRAEADRITAEADGARAQFQAGRISPGAVRQQYLALLERFQHAQQRFVPARDAFKQLDYLRRIRDVAQECQMRQRRVLQHVQTARDLGGQLQATADGLDGRLVELVEKAEEFDALKAELEAVIGELQDKAGGNAAQENATARLRAQLDACVLPTIPEGQARAAQIALEDLAGRWQELAETQLPRMPAFKEFERHTAVAADAVGQLGPDRYAAEEALEKAREALNRLADCIESRPVETVQVPPPRPGETPGSMPPGAVPGGVRIRETSRNVFVAEMAGLPAGARFLWDFGDGSRTETAQPQVQHTYVAPTGGLAGLAGKKWQLRVTVVVNGRAVGDAAYTVSRGRLSDSPINKVGPPPAKIGPIFIPR